MMVSNGLHRESYSPRADSLLLQLPNCFKKGRGKEIFSLKKTISFKVDENSEIGDSLWNTRAPNDAFTDTDSLTSMED